MAMLAAVALAAVVVFTHLKKKAQNTTGEMVLCCTVLFLAVCKAMEMLFWCYGVASSPSL